MRKTGLATEIRERWKRAERERERMSRRKTKIETLTLKIQA